MDKLIEILTSFEQPRTVCTIGNAGISRAAIEAGIDAVFAYPGTPSTEISEVFNQASKFQNHPGNQADCPELCANKVYFEYSINEKVALEKAIAFSIANKSALCVMKNVGMNVASDALMTITYQKIMAPLVIVICDDPGCHSSSNEQDSRYWGQMASVPVFNPSTPAEAFAMTKAAIELSGAIGLPVILRSTTRVSHSRAELKFGKIQPSQRMPGFTKLPEHINIPARTAILHQNALKKLETDAVYDAAKKFSTIYFEGKNKRKALISSGVATCYLRELIMDHQLENEVELLDLGLIHPFPETLVLNFLKKGFTKILVTEELDPIVETAVRAWVQKENIEVEILGKGFSGLVTTGEFSLDLIKNVLEEFLERKLQGNKALEKQDTLTAQLPPRPPLFCAGCPHRATYYALKLLIPRDKPDYVVCGDIGCFGLGALPPFRMVDTVNHMGMSISMAQGLSEALKNKDSKVISLQGDGTFFHSGITSLLNAVYTKSNLLLVIFDNRTVGMTGQQQNPGATGESNLNEADLPMLIRGLGVKYVDTLMPFDNKDTFRKMEKALKNVGISVLISKAPCVFLPDYKTQISQDKKVLVDPGKCNTCHNNPESHLFCSRQQNPAVNLKRAIAKIKAPYSYPASDYSCPANICNLGFFQSILEDNPGMALQTVRDKLLFSRTCGDLCHRPCELFSPNGEKETLPIKSLKKYASGIEENFRDFSIPINLALNSTPKNVKVAVVGAGPAGLSAAYDLIRTGYEVHVFEKENAAGGIIKWVIPAFRMDKESFAFEISQLEKMGVTFHFNTVLGQDVSLKDLRKEYNSVILALGLGKIKALKNIEEQLPDSKWSDCLSFLKKFNAGEISSLQKARILVIGGGNSAMDAARAALRLEHNEVFVSCLEEKPEMPAFTEEIEHAIHEGITLFEGTEIISCHYDKDINIKLKTLHDESIRELHFDYVITAIGQCGRTEDYAETRNELSTDGRIPANEQTAATTEEGVFVAGDLCDTNHQSLIGAIASGKRAAIGVRKKWEDYPYAYPALDALLALNKKPLKNLQSREIQGDITDKDYLQQFNLYASCAKCNHCIDHFGCPAMIKINGKVQIIDSLCTRCGLCIDVCPNDAIHWEENIKV